MNRVLNKLVWIAPLFLGAAMFVFTDFAECDGTRLLGSCQSDVGSDGLAVSILEDVGSDGLASAIQAVSG